MKVFIFIFSVIFLGIYFLSCNKSTPVEITNPTQIMPLKVGNAWVTSFTQYDSNGVVSKTGIDSNWISQDSIVDGNKYFLMLQRTKYSSDPNYFITSKLVRNSPLGFAVASSGPEIILYNYPYHNGDTTVVATNQKVDVPAGSFDCILYRTRYGYNAVYQPIIAETYICHNTGVIKQHLSIAQNDSVISQSILTQVVLH